MRRRRPRASFVLLALSVLLGAGATAILEGHLARLQARAATGEDLAEVAAASRSLPRGAVLTPDMIRPATLPLAYLPPGAVTAAEAEGRRLGAGVAAGEIITEARLARGGPVAALVPPGLRAVAVDAALPAGALAPGDHVDVIATFLSGSPHAETVAEDVEVLQVVAGDPVEGVRASTVFLVVAPETAERLAYTRTVAEVSLAIGGSR